MTTGQRAQTGVHNLTLTPLRVRTVCICDNIVPQCLVETEAREVEETQIFFGDHAAEVITVKRDICSDMRRRAAVKSRHKMLTCSAVSQLEMERLHLSEGEETL